MRTRAIIQIEGRPEPYEEDMDMPEGADPVEFWQGVLDNFNNTLRPHEKPRSLVSAERLDEAARKHVWDKTNLVTIVKKHTSYDELKCRGCGITAKGHGVPWRIELDARYRRSNVFKRCDHAADHLAKLAAKADTAEIPH